MENKKEKRKQTSHDNTMECNLNQCDTNRAVN